MVGYMFVKLLKSSVQNETYTSKDSAINSFLNPGVFVGTSVPKTSIPSAVVYYYFAWYTYFRNGR